jgi:HAE1 family hydrophobic/amphiphilic exporter-1
MKYMTSDAGNDGEASIQVVFNLGTDPNQAAINVQNRVASVVNKLPPLVVREGVKITREVPSMLMYVNLLVRIKIQIKSFYTIMQISMSYLN